MTLIAQVLPMMEIAGLPEYFYTDIGKTEPAGGDCVRVYCCIRRDGMLIPQFTVVIPSASLIVAARVATEAAIDVHNGREMMGRTAH